MSVYDKNERKIEKNNFCGDVISMTKISKSCGIDPNEYIFTVINIYMNKTAIVIFDTIE